MNWVKGGVLLFFAVVGMGIVTGEVRAEEVCAPVDLRKVFSMKIRDQQDLSWCYAHTAADYLQFYHRIPEQISAADIAIRYNRRFWPILLQILKGNEVRQYGFLRPALWDAMEQGYCPEAAFPSDEWSRVSGSTEAGEVERQPIGAAILQILALHAKVQEGRVRKAGELPYFYEFRGIDKNRFFEILASSERRDLLLNLRDAACEGRRKALPRAVGRISMRPRGASAFERIRGHLESGIPASIDYFDGVLEDSTGFKRNLNNIHTSLVVGQRFDASRGECQYLIKNSYGEDCSEYDPRLTCEAGYLWIGEKALSRALFSYVRIHP
jgi:hypothetical protein